jgi:stage II sporulation protein D
MAQWGADGYAQHGWTYKQILAHYYQGTTIGAVHAPAIRVLLLDGRKTVTITSDSPWKVVDAAGTTVQLQAGPLAVGAGLAVSGHTLVSPLTFSPGKTPLRIGKSAYRGTFLLVSNGKSLQLVNSLPLESYVLGVVPSEMPSTWPAAALEAQAVAARSYALAELENVVTARAYDVYDDTRSQVYGGIDAESSAATAAVQATAKQVVLYKSKVATTYFSSSSGGRTVSAAEAWGTPVAYLQSVPDPYDTLSPYHDWGPVLFDAAKVARELKIPGQLVSLGLTPGPSDHVETVDAVGTKGSVKVTSADVRSVLGLRSTWFSVGWLALAAPTPAIAYGGGGKLTGIARGVSGPVTLEQKDAKGWQQVTTVSPAADGSFSVSIDPAATTQYRLAAGLVRAALVKVPVVPVVSAAATAGSVQGSIRPALGGAAVQLQQQDGAGWKTVASGTTDAAGAFSVAAQLSPGSYRVRCAPGHGLSPGLSQPILQT